MFFFSSSITFTFFSVANVLWKLMKQTLEEAMRSSKYKDLIKNQDVKSLCSSIMQDYSDLSLLVGCGDPLAALSCLVNQKERVSYSRSSIFPPWTHLGHRRKFDPSSPSRVLFMYFRSFSFNFFSIASRFTLTYNKTTTENAN